MERMRKRQEGFTLVELMIVVAIIGILAVLAIYGVTKYITNAKTGEARNALGQIAKSAVAAYEEERSDATLIAPGTAGLTNTHQVCGIAGTPAHQGRVPAALTEVGNKKYQSSQQPNKDWNTGDRNNGWVCLKFALTEPQYFQYGYGATPGGDNPWVAVADSDLKGPGAVSTYGFSIGGQLAGGTKQMTVTPQIQEFDGVPAALPPGITAPLPP